MRTYSGAGTATCKGASFVETTLRHGECLPAPSSSRIKAPFMKVKGSAPLGRVPPTPSSSGVCVEYFVNNNCAAKKGRASVCCATNTCIDNGDATSVQYNCSAPGEITWSNSTTCTGSNWTQSYLTVQFGTCVHGREFANSYIDAASNCRPIAIPKQCDDYDGNYHHCRCSGDCVGCFLCLLLLVGERRSSFWGGVALTQ